MLQEFREYIKENPVSKESSKKWFKEVYFSQKFASSVDQPNTVLNFEQGPPISIREIAHWNCGQYSPIFDNITLFLYLYVDPTYAANVNVHELVHATGASTRLNRDSVLAAAALDPYSLMYEEMVAQYGTYFYLESKITEPKDKKWLYDATIGYPTALAGKNVEALDPALQLIYDNDFSKLEDDIMESIEYMENKNIGKFTGWFRDDNIDWLDK